MKLPIKLIIWISLILFGIFSSKKVNIKMTHSSEVKADNLFLTVIIFFLTYLTFISTECPDYSMYEVSYNALVKSQNVSTASGIIYDETARFLGTHFGVTFQIFKTGLVFISLLIYAWFIRKYTTNGKYVFALYMLYPALLDMVQFRFMISLAIFLIAINFFLKDGIKNKIMFSAVLFIAAMIHSSLAFFYILLVIPMLPYLKRYYKGLIIGICIITVLFQKYLIYFLSFLISGMRFERYLRNSTTGTFGFIFYVINFYINYRIAQGIYFQAQQNKDLTKNDSKFLYFNYVSKILVFLSVPLVAIAPDFLRLQRMLYVFSYIGFMILEDILKEKTIKIKVIASKYVVLNIRIFSLFYCAISCFIYIYYFTPEVVTSIIL